MKTPSFLLVLAFCLLFVCAPLLINAQLYSLIAEPLGGLETTPNYPVRDTQSPIEFSYATPDSPAGTDDSSERTVIIVMDLLPTSMGLTTCYIGNGQIQDYERLTYNDHLIVKSIVTTGQFFTVLCTLSTPEHEQLQTTTTANIYELQYGYTVVATAGAGQVLTLKQIAEEILGPVKENAPRLNDPSLPTPTHLTLGGTADVTLPEVFTSDQVFSWTYQFAAGQRILMNTTELDLIRDQHFQYLTDRTRGQTVDDVYILDHYATFDEDDKPDYIYVTLYTNTSTSQFDFKLGLQGLMRTYYASLPVPITLTALTHSTNLAFNSYCFNDKQDFGETSTNCGDPKVAGCSHCYFQGSTCTADAQCSLNNCVDGRCEVKYGTRIVSSAIMHFSAVTMAAMVVAAMFFM